MKRVLGAALLVLALVGCGKDKVTDVGDDLVLPYPEPITPADAVFYYKLAWERQDSVRVGLILAEDYMGMSTDLTDPSSGTLTFAKSDEVGSVHAMDNTDVLSISVDLGPSSTWIRTSYPSDPEGWATIQIPSSLIQVDTHSHGTLETSGSGLMEFKMKPVTISGADTTWAIVRWTEIRTGV